MQLALIFLIGFLLGGVVTYRLIVHSLRRIHPADANYVPMARAVMKYARMHGTVNHKQVGQLLSVSSPAAKSHLEQMEKDGLLHLHVHNNGQSRRKNIFYTLLS